MKYFTITPSTKVDDLKYRYRELCKTMHPDKGGDSLEFIEMGEEFRSALNTLSKKTTNPTEQTKAQELLKEILQSIIQNPNTIYRIADLFSDKERLGSIAKTIMNKTIDSLKREILK